MAKHKAHRALFDLLRKDRPEDQARPEAVKPTPVIRQTPAVKATPLPTVRPAPAAKATPKAPVRPAPTAAAPTAAVPAGKPAAAPPPSAQAARPAPARAVPTGPVIRPVEPAAAKPAVARPALGAWPLKLSYYHLAIALIAVACLCLIYYVAGQYFAPGPPLPAVPKGPTFDDVRTKAPAPGLVTPGPVRPAAPEVATERRPAPGPPAGPGPRPGPSPKGGVAEKAPAASGPQYRVRIARLPVTQPAVIDKLRDFLSQKNIETELEARSGYYVLYGAERLADKRKSDELAAQINKHLEAFEKQTRIPTSADAYSIQVTKE
jgi:hypothetical protein